MKYSEEQFSKIWDMIINDFQNIRRIRSFIIYLLYDRENGINFINRIQDYLYKKKIIRFKVTDKSDYLKIDEIEDKDISLLMEYFCLANVELKELRNEIS